MWAAAAVQVYKGSRSKPPENEDIGELEEGEEEDRQKVKRKEQREKMI